MDKRSVHGGKDSHLEIEVSAVRSHRGHRETTYSTVNHEPSEATAFAVYIRNPLAFHVHDFRVPAWPGRERPDSDAAGRAKAKAFAYADALAEHLGCAVVSHLKREG